jgi:Tol biopolymer transport system component
MTSTHRPGYNRRRLQPGQVSEIVVIDRDGSRRQVIYETGDLIEAPNWTVDGKWLIFNGDGRLWKISPDGREGPIRINTAPIESLNNDHCLAPDGEHVYLSSGTRHLHVAPLSGGEPTKLSNDQDPARQFIYYLHGVSPDGETLSYVGYEKSPEGKTITNIYTIPARGGPDAKLTDVTHPVDGPEFSPDGQWIYFNSEQAATRPGHAQIFRMKADGSNVEQLTFDERVNWFPHFPPQGDIVAFISFPPGTEGHPADKDVLIRTMNPDGSNVRDIDSFLGGQGTINVNSWAPTGDRLAYVAYPMKG